MKKILLAASVLLLAPAASAQIIVLGQGPAQACYQAALTGDQGSRSALEECDTALDREMLSRKDRAATFVNRGVLTMRAGQYEAAETDYERALDLMPDLSEAHINHGVALYHQGRYGDAITAYTRAIEAGSDKVVLAYFNRALAYEQTDDLRAAYRDLKHAVELAPDWPQAQASLARFSVTRPDS